MGMAKEYAEVYLVSVLNQDTLSHMETDITLWGGDEIDHLETTQDRL